MKFYRPPLCSEREPGGYEDCTWASAVMLNNAHHGYAAVPSTRFEYESLRVAGGDGPRENPGDGSNQAQAQIGIVNRYRWLPQRKGLPGTYISFDKWWSILTPGMGSSVQGSLGGFPKGHRLRRWDTHFTGAHDVYVQREDNVDYVWWMDPLAVSTYPGERVDKDDLRRYFNGFRGGSLFAPVGAVPPWGSDVPPNIRAVDPAGIRVAAAVRKTGIDYKTAVNMGDLERAMKRAKINYKTAVNPIDVRALLDWARTH